MPIYARDKVVHGISVREVKKVTGSFEDAIRVDTLNRNQPIALAVNVIDRHR